MSTIQQALIMAIPSGGGGSGSAITGVSRGDLIWGTSLTMPTPAGMLAGDNMIAILGTADVPTFPAGQGWTNRTPGTWPADKQLWVSDAYASVPGTQSITFGANGGRNAGYASATGIANAATLGGNSATGTGTAELEPHVMAYSTTAANSAVVLMVDFTGGSVTGAQDPDTEHSWAIRAGEGYAHFAAVVRETAGSYDAELEHIGGLSSAPYVWAELGAS